MDKTKKDAIRYFKDMLNLTLTKEADMYIRLAVKALERELKVEEKLDKATPTKWFAEGIPEDEVKEVCDKAKFQARLYRKIFDDDTINRLAMYESPVKQVIGELQTKMESDFMCQISQTIGYDIDKYELIRALNYDREQYQKGYTQGYLDGLNISPWIPVSEALPDENEEVLVTYKKDGGKYVYVFKYFSNSVWWDRYVTAWAKLPKAYEEKSTNS